MLEKIKGWLKTTALTKKWWFWVIVAVVAVGVFFAFKFVEVGLTTAFIFFWVGVVVGMVVRSLGVKKVEAVSGPVGTEVVETKMVTDNAVKGDTLPSA